MEEPLETAALQAFCRTVDARSLSRAAQELGVPRATLSRRLARLEQRLGTRLLRRSTRSLALTDAGEALYRHARIVLDAAGQAEASVRQTDQRVRGELRVSVPPIINDSFQAMLCGFVARYPEVKLQVHVSSQLVDLRRDGYDVAIRATAGVLEPGLIARTLARTPVLLVASPDYIARHGMPRTRRELSSHRCLTGFARGALPQSHWPVAGGGRQQVEGVLSSNDVPLLVAAAERGLGIAFVPLVAVLPQLKSGALAPVLLGTIAAEARVSVLYLERELMPPQVRAFVDAVVEWAPGQLAPELPEQCQAAARRALGQRGSRKKVRSAR